MHERVTTTRMISIGFMCALCACSGEKSAQQADKVSRQATEVDASKSAATGCDASLWDHVYEPARLQQINPCVTVIGTITESDANRDGDQHFLLRLDPGQDALVNKRNQKKKSGDLVLEIVCANPASQKKAKAACTGYTNPIAIPQVGAHVAATGTYVIDSHNGWAEIHPVSRLVGN